MATNVQCTNSGSYNIYGKVSDALAKTGGVAAGLLGGNFGYDRTWQQFCCLECHEAFKEKWVKPIL